MEKRIFIWLDDEREIPVQWIKRVADDIYFVKVKNAQNLINWFKINASKY